jgi:hypothetical protein
MDSIPRNEEQEYHKLKLYTNSATLVGAFFCYTGAQQQATSKKLRAGWDASIIIMHYVLVVRGWLELAGTTTPTRDSGASSSNNMDASSCQQQEGEAVVVLSFLLAELSIFLVASLFLLLLASFNNKLQAD